MLVNNVYGRYATFFKNHELKEADEYIKRVFPDAEFYIDYEHALVFERIGEDEEKLNLAILDEIGELTHELKANWCWWKKSQAPVDNEKVLG